VHQLLSIIFLFIFIDLTHASILPENDLEIPATKISEGLSEQKYNMVINKVENIYRPIIEQMGHKLTIERLWTNPRVNASTILRGKEIVIYLFGGYARHPKVTEDAYALVICHELGHHLGGAPRKHFASGALGWPSTEGQADYFATLKCLRKVFRQDDNADRISNLEIPSVVEEGCSGFRRYWERAMCMRTTMAGLIVSNITANVSQGELPMVETPDPTIVQKTTESHPKAQCRLDTYFQGSICEVSSYRSVSATNEIEGTCHPSTGHELGTRPLCWFKPSQRR
jgi:hypothetical protein